MMDYSFDIETREPFCQDLLSRPVRSKTTPHTKSGSGHVAVISREKIDKRKKTLYKQTTTKLTKTNIRMCMEYYKENAGYPPIGGHKWRASDRRIEGQIMRGKTVAAPELASRSFCHASPNLALKAGPANFCRETRIFDDLNFDVNRVHA
jgi:hypothetical protein